MLDYEKMFPVHFGWPQFLKDFLHQLSLKPTFINALGKPEEDDDFVRENRWLRYDYQNGGSIKANEPKPIEGTVVFGVGHYQYSTIVRIQLDFKNKRARIIRVFCTGPYCSSERKTYYPIPKHSVELVKNFGLIMKIG